MATTSTATTSNKRMNEDALAKLRKRIDEIDEQLLELFKR
jgi:chorismate mutase